MAASASRDRISVDLRGMKAALLARAQGQGVTPSDFIRARLGEVLGREPVGKALSVAERSAGIRVRFSLRMTRQQAQQLRERARAAGMPAGAFVAGLCAGAPLLVSGQRPKDQAAALIRSCAELSTLARDLRQLTQLLRHADTPAANAYRASLESVEREVRAHLAQASALMADLQPLRASKQAPAKATR